MSTVANSYSDRIDLFMGNVRILSEILIYDAYYEGCINLSFPHIRIVVSESNFLANSNIC